MRGAIYIVATGVRTPLGLRSAPAAAAYRAGISRLGEHPSMVDRLGKPMVAAVDPRLDPGLVGPARHWALGEPALGEIAEALAERGASVRAVLHVALPELRPGFAREDVVEIERQLRGFTDRALGVDDVTVYPRGHAAAAPALHAAMEDLRAEKSDVAVVGGIDTYFHADTMNWLDDNRQLAGDDGRSSFVPGEGAGFLLLATDSASRRLGLAPRARVMAAAFATEHKLIKTPAICLGEGLTAAVRMAVEAAGANARVNDVYCDVNGERYRSQEWAFVCLRLSHHFDDPTNYRSPAGSWGDMGAASLPLFATLACQALKRGYATGSRAMLWASSEAGLRGAIVVEDVRS